MEQKVDIIKEFEIVKERLIDTEKDLTKRELENEVIILLKFKFIYIISKN